MWPNGPRSEITRGVHYAIGNLLLQIYIYLISHFSLNILNTYACTRVFRFFPTIESYLSHVQLHQTSCRVPQKLPPSELTVTKIAERSREIKRDEQYYENVKSLMCPTCGKVWSRPLHFHIEILFHILCNFFIIYYYRFVPSKAHYQITCALMNRRSTNATFAAGHSDFLYAWLDIN